MSVFLNAVGNIGKNIFQAGGARFTPTRLAPKSISEIFKDAFSGVSKPAITPKLRLPKPSGGTKLLVGGGLVTTTVLGSQLFLLTDEGQQTLDTVDDNITKLTDFGEDVGDTLGGFTNFFGDNPILLPLLLGLGIILAVKS